MPTLIKCPKCFHEFPLEEAMSEEYKKDLREQMTIYKKQKDEETEKKELEWQKKFGEMEKKQQAILYKEKEKFREEVQTTLRKSITADFENKFQLLEKNNIETEAKLKDARSREFEFFKKRGRY